MCDKLTQIKTVQPGFKWTERFVDVSFRPLVTIYLIKDAFVFKAEEIF